MLRLRNLKLRAKLISGFLLLLVLLGIPLVTSLLGLRQIGDQLSDTISTRTEALQKSARLHRNVFELRTQEKALLLTDGPGELSDALGRIDSVRAEANERLAELGTLGESAEVKELFQDFKQDFRRYLGVLEKNSDLVDSGKVQQDITLSRTNGNALDASGVLLWDWDMVTDRIVLMGGGDHPIGRIFEHASNLNRESWLQFVHPDDVELKGQMLAAHLDYGAACFECELRLRAKDDQWIWVFERGVVIEYRDDGTPLRMAGTLLDVTERKRAEEERARVTRAEAESQAKSRFLASMSHEMWTPLNAILGYAQLMKHESGLSERQRDSLSTIVRSGDHLLSLINEVLDMARIESGTLPVTLSEVKLRELLVDIERMFRLKAQERGLMLRLTGVEQLPRSIHSDARKIRQVLINLLGNAMKFTEAGEITLEADCITCVDDKVELSISVCDTGIGIAEKDIEAIFESFVQTEDGSRRSGAGLGLAVS